MDVGKSLNPAIDVGQIEGGFMQGVGLFLLEELVYDESGRLCTAGPVTYKIPAINDTPLEFNVSFLLGPGNPKAIYSSKVLIIILLIIYNIINYNTITTLHSIVLIKYTSSFYRQLENHLYSWPHQFSLQ